MKHQNHLSLILGFKMGFFDKLGKLTTQSLVTGLSPLADIVTLGGELTDKDQTYTEKNLRKLGDRLDDIFDGDDED